MKTILVTGGAGFIGSHLVEALLAAGNRKVVCVDDFSSARAWGMADEKEYLQDVLNTPSFVLYEADIRDMAKMQEIFKAEKPDAIVHLAARADTRHAVLEPREYIDVNIVGTLNLLECSREFNVKTFIFASSSSVYGNKNTAPYTEDAQTDFAISPYGASKKAGEVLAHTYNHNFGINITCVRIFNAYGERMRPGLVLYKWVDNMLHGKPVEQSGDGSRKRDFTYVGDLVQGLVAALEKANGFEVVNIGNADPVSLKELLAVTEEATGQKADVVMRESHHASVEATHASIDRARQFLGWQPTTPLKDGVSRFVAWFRANRLK